MDPNQPIVLKGENAKAFEKYQKRKATKEEIEFMQKSEKFYLKHCKDRNITSRKK